MPQTWTYAVTIRHYVQSKFHAVPLDGYRVIDLCTHNSTFMGDDLYQIKQPHQNYTCYRGQNVDVSK